MPTEATSLCGSQCPGRYSRWPVLIEYPPETLHEIVTNAVIHRDYSIADDVHIRSFDNRIEVQSPSRLPAHVTVKNILNERFARNGAIVRILNKFADPPHKDVGEGLNTAFAAMHKLRLKEPVIEEQENAVLVSIRHEPLLHSSSQVLRYSRAQFKHARLLGYLRSCTNVTFPFPILESKRSEGRKWEERRNTMRLFLPIAVRA